MSARMIFCDALLFEDEWHGCTAIHGMEPEPEGLVISGPIQLHGIRYFWNTRGHVLKWFGVPCEHAQTSRMSCSLRITYVLRTCRTYWSNLARVHLCLFLVLVFCWFVCWFISVSLLKKGEFLPSNWGNDAVVLFFCLFMCLSLLLVLVFRFRIYFSSESTNKEVNRHSKDVTQTRQRPESPMVTLT